MNYFKLIFQRYYLIGLTIGGLAFLTLLLIHFFVPRIYESKVSIYIQRQIPNGYNAETIEDLRDHVRIFKSDLVLDQVMKILKKRFPKHEQLTKKEFRQRLRVDNGISLSQKMGLSKVVDIRFQDTNPKFATTVITESLRAYEKAFQYITQETKVKTIGFLEEHLKDVQTKRAKLEKELQAVQESSGTTDINIKNTELVRLQTHYAKQLGTLNADIASNDEQIQNLESMLNLNPEDARKIASIKEDETLRNWQDALADEMTEYSKMSSLYTEKHPKMQEKQEAINELKNLISERTGKLYGERFILKGQNYSSADKEFSKQLVSLSLKNQGLIGQRNRYSEVLAATVNSNTAVAEERREMLQLQFAIESLLAEERKLNDKIQDGLIEQANLLNLGSFVLLSPPTVPSPNEYVFPLNDEFAIPLIIALSMILGVVAIGLAELINPTIHMDRTDIPILGELKTHERQRMEEGIFQDLLSVYQNIASLNRNLQFKTIVFQDLFEPEDATEFYRDRKATGVASYLPYLGVLFSRRNIKTLLVDCSGQNWDKESIALFDAQTELITNIDQFGYYRFKYFNHLHLLKAHPGQAPAFDHYLLEMLPDYKEFQLILIQRAAPQTRSEMLGLSTAQSKNEATVLSVSKSLTSWRDCQTFLNAAKHGEIQLLGSILFP